MSDIDIREKVEELIIRLTRAVQICRMYGEKHHLTQDAVEGFHTILNDILASKDDVTIGIIGNEFAFEKEPLYDLSIKRRGFIHHLKTIGVKKISFVTGVTVDELLEFTKILNVKSESIKTKKDILKVIGSSGIKHIAVGDIGFEEVEEPVRFPEARMRHLVKNNYKKNMQMLSKTFKELKGNQHLNVQSARQLVEGLISNLTKNKNLLLMLTSMRSHDGDTLEHGVNVAVFTLLQAEMLGIEEKYLVDMGVASMLHDIGKLTVPTELLKKEAEGLTKKESHNIIEQRKALQDIKGAKILLETEGISPLAAIVAFEHNMRYDLKGYPRKLYGKKLNLISMMITISDYYDQLRKKSFYYKAGGAERAYEEMTKRSGSYFHPDLLKNFFSAVGVYPPGTLVELDTGEIAIVIQGSMFDIKRPQVEILYDKDGEKYKDPQIINLVEKDKRGRYKRSIKNSVSPLDKFKVPEKYSLQ